MHSKKGHGWRRLATVITTLGLVVGLPLGAAAPARAAVPTLTISGTLKVGETITAVAENFVTAPTEFAWYSYAAESGGNGSWIGAGSTYTLASGDAGRYIVAYTPTNSVLSARYGPVVGLVRGTPVISGTPAPGNQLSVDNGTWTPTPDSYSYQWVSDGADITGATSATYTPSAGDVGAMISVKVTGSKTDYADATATSAAVGPVAVAEFTAGVPEVSGEPVVGSSLWAYVGSWTPTPDSYSYQWLRNSNAITGATGDGYRLVAADLGAKISVRVTAHKTGLDDLAATSAQTAAVAAAPAATLTAFSASDVVIGTGRCVTVPVTATYQVSTYEAWAVTKVTLTSKVTNKRGKKIGTVTLTGSGPDYTPVSVGTVSPNRRSDLIGTATGTFKWCTGDYLGAIKFAAPTGTWAGTLDSTAVGGSITSTLTATGHVKAALRLATPKLTVKGTKRTLTATFKTWVPAKKGWRALAGTKVTVQKLVDGNWVRFKTVRLSHSGKVKTSWKASTSASYRLAFAGNSITTDGVTAVVTG